MILVGRAFDSSTSRKMPNNIQIFEESTIVAFFASGDRERLIQLLSTPKRRNDALGTFYHSVELEGRWALPVKSTSNVLKMLMNKGAPSEAYLMGTSRDQETVPLVIALALVERESGMLVCRPGQLAYYCGKNAERRLILEKKQTSARLAGGAT